MESKEIKEFHPTDRCPVRGILSRFGDKWSLLVLITLSTNGTLRFGEIHRSIGDISQRMLTVTLRTLEREGLVKRTVYPEVPPRVEYALTDRGCGLMPHITALVGWAEANRIEVTEQRTVVSSAVNER